MRKNGKKTGGGTAVIDDAQLSLFGGAPDARREKADTIDQAASDLVKTAFANVDMATGLDGPSLNEIVMPRNETKLVLLDAPALGDMTGIASPDRVVNDIGPSISDRFPSLAIHQTYKDGTTRARLVGMLNECLDHGTMPRSEKNRSLISRKHFASRLSVHVSLLVSLKDILSDYEVVLEVIAPVASLPQSLKFGGKIGSGQDLDNAATFVASAYPGLFKHQFYPVDSTANQIVKILNCQLVAGGLVRSRGGKISRLDITTELGLSKAASVIYQEIFEAYETEVGGKESVTEAKIPAMREWLEEQIRDRSLQIRDGKISRIQFLEHFGFSKTNTIFIRYPRVAKLIEDFDSLMVETNYQPVGVEQKLQKLRELLEDPPLGKDGKSFDKRELNNLLELPKDTILRHPYANVVAAAEVALLDKLKNDPLLAFAGGRVFKCHPLVEHGWSQTFAAKFKTTFERVFLKEKKDATKVAFASATELLFFIAGNRSAACTTLLSELSSGARAGTLGKEFTLATQAYRDSLVERYEHAPSRNAKLSSTNSVIKAFSNVGFFPPHELALIAFREDGKNYLRSVAEVTEGTSGKRKNPHVDDYLNFATSMLKQAADVRQIELAGADQGDFTRVLRAELEAHEFKAAEDPSKVILHVLTRRLDLIKQATARVLNAGRALWDRGRELLASARDIGDDWGKIRPGADVTQTVRRQIFREYFPSEAASKEQGVANLLKLVADQYGSLYPTYRREGREEGQFFQKRALEYGGALLLQSYLMPSQETVCAAITLYLLESGSNVSVARTLYRDCVEPSELPNHSKITGYKARAGGKPIFATLPDRSDAIKAMNWLREGFERNQNVAEGDENQMFLVKGQDETLKLVEEWTYRNEFKRLTKSVPELANLPLTPNMLRPSILLKSALETDPGTGISMAIGQHTAQVHEGYINKYPIRYLRDTDIRLFQYSMETVVIKEMDDLHDFLNVDQEGMARRVEAVMRTGLGTMCGDRYGKPGNEGKLCQSLDCVKGCPQLILIAVPKEIAILQVWQHSLRLVEGDWIRDQPARWEKVWLPWLCFCDAVEVKMRQSFSDVWSDASEISSEMIANPNFLPMRLF